MSTSEDPTPPFTRNYPLPHAIAAQFREEAKEFVCCSFITMTRWWRGCRRAHCRRARDCTHPNFACVAWMFYPQLAQEDEDARLDYIDRVVAAQMRQRKKR